jgi:predicted transcriptional regulator
MRGFGDLESVIMQALWDRDEPTSVRQVWETLQPDRPLAYNTVLTVVDNLYKKGWLHRERDGRAFLYRPKATRADYGVQLMRDAMAESGDPAGALVHFLRQLDDQQSATIRAALQGYETGERPS